MKEIYRKHGRSARYEDGHVVLVSESGEAIEEDGRFTVSPLADEQRREPMNPAEVEQTASAIEAAIAPFARLERLIVSHGIADHEFGDVRWTEETRRVHLALVHGRARVLIDRADFKLGEIPRVAEALRRCGAERDAPSRLRVAPNVAAALLPSLVGIAPPNIELVQMAGGRDGKGVEIAATPLHEPPWPNFYRPSYRVRPQRMPFNITARYDVTAIDGDLPEAVALLAPVQGTLVRALVVDRNASYPTTIRIVRIDAIAHETTWYPYAAGAWGAEMML